MREIAVGPGTRSMGDVSSKVTGIIFYQRKSFTVDDIIRQTHRYLEGSSFQADDDSHREVTEMLLDLYCRNDGIVHRYRQRRLDLMLSFYTVSHRLGVRPRRDIFLYTIRLREDPPSSGQNGVGCRTEMPPRR